MTGRLLRLCLIALAFAAGGVSAADLPPRREYDVLKAFPPGRLAYLHRADTPDAAGLTGTNRATGRWLEVGPQRGSCRGVLAAVVAGDLELADRCWRGIDLAFSHQRADGSFEAEIRPNGASARPLPAAVETTCFFLQELGRAILVIRQSPHEAHFRERLTALEPKLRRACAFLLAGYDVIIPNTSHAANRIIIAAKAFGLCGLVLDDPRLIDASRRLTTHALTLRDDGGVFLEKGGRDSSYSVVSILFGQVLALHLPLPEFEAGLVASGRWAVSRVGADGRIDVEGNTRTGVGKEPGFDGVPKHVNYNEVIYALTLLGVIHGDQAALGAADRVFAYAKANPKR
jgi:hypothetical protein